MVDVTDDISMCEPMVTVACEKQIGLTLHFSRISDVTWPSGLVDGIGKCLIVCDIDDKTPR